MQIIVNTRLLIKDKQEGIGWFTQGVLERICQKNKEVHFIFLFDRAFDDSFLFSDNITPLVISPPARHPFLWYYWMQFGVKPLLNKFNPDLFFSPDGFLALGAKCPQVPVIHDINFLHYPHFLKPLTARYYNHYFPKFAQAANRVMTVSEFSKGEIHQHYGVASEKIDVVYNGVNSEFRPLNAEEKTVAKKKFAEGCPYFIYTGSLHPRKNIERTVQAYLEFRAASDSEIKLVLAGPAFWGNQAVVRLIQSSGYAKDIVLTGRLSNADLALALGGAEALLFVPLYEGFGIPLIEAMTAGVPVLTSQVTSLPEVAGTAALFCDPTSVSNISEGMRRIVNPEEKALLIKKGLERANAFSWDRSADLVWESLMKTLER